MGRGAPRAGMSPVPAISASEPDWSREVPRSWWDPGYRLLRAVRRYQAARGTRLGPFPGPRRDISVTLVIIT